MRRKLVYLIAVTGILFALLPAIPASATVNAGPWDVKVNWWEDPSTHGLKIESKATFGTDDTTAYVICLFYHRAVGNVTTWSSENLVATATPGLRQQANMPSVPVSGNFAPYTVGPVFIVNATGANCDSPTKRSIRGRGGVSDVPTANITNVVGTGNVGTPLAEGANPPATLPTTAVTCTRILSQNNGSNVATFDGTLPTVTGITDTYSWVWGDSTTNGTTLDAQHVYPALSSMPSGGWTATLTVTRTGNGTTYEVGPSTTTCSLRVDFLNPSQSTPSTTTTDQPEDTDCPTGFGWLNPLAIAKILKCLFIPSSSQVNSVGNLWGDMTTKAPFSWAYEVVTYPGAVLQAMHDAAQDERQADEGGVACTDLSQGAFEPFLPSTNPQQNGTTNCALESQYMANGNTFWLFRNIIKYLFLFATALAVWQAVTWAVS